MLAASSRALGLRPASRPARKASTNGVRVTCFKDSGSSERVTVQFKLPFETRFGDNVAVVGSFTGWDVGTSLQLQWSEGSVWTGETELPVGETVEYKYIITTAGSNAVTWQPGNNLSLQLNDGTKAVLVLDDWTGHKRVVEAEVEAEVPEKEPAAPAAELVAEAVEEEKEAAPAVPEPEPVAEAAVAADLKVEAVEEPAEPVEVEAVAEPVVEEQAEEKAEQLVVPTEPEPVAEAAAAAVAEQQEEEEAASAELAAVIEEVVAAAVGEVEPEPEPKAAEEEQQQLAAVAAVAEVVPEAPAAPASQRDGSVVYTAAALAELAELRAAAAAVEEAAAAVEAAAAAVEAAQHEDAPALAQPLPTVAASPAIAVPSVDLVGAAEKLAEEAAEKLSASLQPARAPLANGSVVNGLKKSTPAAVNGTANRTAVNGSKPAINGVDSEDSGTQVKRVLQKPGAGKKEPVGLASAFASWFGRKK